MTIERRSLLKGLAALPLLWPGRSVLAADQSGLAEVDGIAADLHRYIALGSKASGGEGDNAAGEWFAQQLTKAGFKTERTPFDAPCFQPLRVELEAEGATASLIPQAVVTPTTRDGVEGPLFRFDPQAPSPVPAGAIAIVDLPRQAWSSVTAPVIEQAIAACEQGGAKGIVLVTNGPTGEAIALNAHEDRPASSLPVACLAPRDAEAFLDLAARSGRGKLVVFGQARQRRAFNVIGRRPSRNARATVIVSTPRSGWFTCAAERGPGIALWLDLLRWSATAELPINLIFSAHSGHEYENLGLRRQLAHLPKPDDVDLWLMFGAGTVTRATHEATGRFTVLSSPNDRRSLTVTDKTEAVARGAFADWPGWADPGFSRGGGASEAGTAIANGYAGVIGFNGGNPYHHVQSDLGANVDAHLIRQVSIACRDLIRKKAS